MNKLPNLTYRVSNLKISTENDFDCNWKLTLLSTTEKFWYRQNVFQIKLFLFYLVHFPYWTPCKLPSLSSQTHNFHRAIVLLILAFGLLALDLGSSENHLEKGHKGQITSVTNLFACMDHQLSNFTVIDEKKSFWILNHVK